MSTDPLVSVIIPAYNAASYIRETIRSVLEQTYANIEIIIINDGSTDRTKDEIKSMHDSRIRYIEQRNGGQCKASNTGIDLARGAYIKFLDADDIINREHIYLMLKKIRKEDNAICGCKWSRFYNNSFEKLTKENEEMWKYHRPLDWLKYVLQQDGNMMSAWLWLIPRNLLDKVGYWDERLSLNNDFEFTSRLLLHAEKIVFAPGAKLLYRTGGETLSVTRTRKAYEAAYLSTKLGCQHLLSAEDSPLIRKICANRYQSWIFQFYPSFPELYLQMEKEIIELGGSNLRLGGGRLLKFLDDLFGWKVAKRIQITFYRLGYLKVIKKLRFKN